MKLSEFAAQLKEDPIRLINTLRTMEGLYVRTVPNSSAVLITAHVTKADFNHELNRYANGLMFDTESRKITVLPSPRFNRKNKNVRYDLSKYKIYKIRDGSIVNFHYNESINQWVMSSANGWDVTNYFWLGNKTYDEAFKECAAKYPNFSFDRLNRNYCYSIGFRHHEFHPLLSDPEALWFVQAVDLSQDMTNGLTVEYDTDIGIPVQQQIVLGPRNSLFSDLGIALSDFIIKQTINYGFILRGDNGQYSNVLLESSLMQKIRKLIYNMPKGMHELSTPAKRNKFIVLRAYLSVDCYDFRSLFPQYEPLIAQYETAITQMATKMCAIMKSGYQFTPVNDRDYLLQSVLEFVKNNKSIDLTGEDGPSIAADVIKHSRNLTPLIKYLCV